MEIKFRDDDLNYFYDYASYARETVSMINGKELTIGVIPYLSGSVTGCLKSVYWGDNSIWKPWENDGWNQFLNVVNSQNWRLAMHGINHTYRKDLVGRVRPEFSREIEISSLEMALKEMVEHCGEIDTFIPPSNAFNRYNYNVVRKYFVNVEYTIGLKSPTKIFNLRSLQMYLQRIYLYYKSNQVLFGFTDSPYDRGSYALVPKTRYDDLLCLLDLHSKKGKDISFAYHYWELEAKTIEGIYLKDIVSKLAREL